MAVIRTDNSRQVIERSREAGRKAIDAAGKNLVREVYKAFGSDYYKGGRFRSTLQVKQSVRRKLPTPTPTGWENLVGTHLMEALYWELGHYNTFTRKHERVRIWEPTARQQTDAMRATYGRVFARYMGGAR
jgi:hypothetical protein